MSLETKLENHMKEVKKATRDQLYTWAKFLPERFAFATTDRKIRDLLKEGVIRVSKKGKRNYAIEYEYIAQKPILSLRKQSVRQEQLFSTNKYHRN